MNFRVGMIVGLNIMLLLGCPFKKDKWLGIVYPDSNDLTKHRITGVYESLNGCLNAVNSKIDQNGAYECGLNCHESEYGGIRVCEETVGNER